MSSEERQGRWLPDPASRAEERWWAGDGWTDLVRDSSRSYLDAEMTDEEAAGWDAPTSRARRWVRRAALVAAGIGALAAALAYSRRGAEQPAPGPARPSRPRAPGRVDFTKAGPVTWQAADGTILGRQRALTPREYRDAVPDAVRPSAPPFRVIPTPMRD